MIIFISGFIKEYGNTMLYTVIMAVISYVGIVIKKFLDDTYKYLYGECSGEEKLNYAISIAKEMFADKGISIGDLELRMMIEYSICEKGGGNSEC